MNVIIENKTLSQFNPISLSEMDSVKLMNRTDTKFVLDRSFFNDILPTLSEGYRSLEIENNRINSYQTLYYDTPTFGYYLDHHNGRGNRYKVRIRNYVESGLFFLEIKNKFKGRTDKNRMKVDGFELNLTERSNGYIKDVIPDFQSLEPKLWNSFQRITLVNQESKERLTLDLNLSFEWEGQSVKYPNVVIAELKQEKMDRNSLFYQTMKSNGVRPYSISKYCIGAVGLYPDLKYNNFKEKLLLLNHF